MSRIGLKPIKIPDGVTINNKKNDLVVKGQLGELNWSLNSVISINIENDYVYITRTSNNKRSRELHGLSRAIVNNMIIGVSSGFKKELQLNGVGYTAELKNEKYILLNLGYSHPIIMEIPDGIKIDVPNQTTIEVSGVNKQVVGEVSAKIRSFRKPEPYKGKGIKYSDEIIRRKAGKAIGVVGS